MCVQVARGREREGGREGGREKGREEPEQRGEGVARGEARKESGGRKGKRETGAEEGRKAGGKAEQSERQRSPPNCRNFRGKREWEKGRGKRHMRASRAHAPGVITKHLSESVGTAHEMRAHTVS